MHEKYKEGKFYKFKYVKTIILEEEYFVFEDSDKEKHLLDVFYYSDYGFKPDEFVNFEVLRIDCSGKIIFEPEHSYYKVGSVYEFDFKRIDIQKTELSTELTGKLIKEKIYNLTVADVFGNEHNLTPHKRQQKKKYKVDKLKCRIDKIIKGNFSLTNMELSSPDKNKLVKLFNNLKS